MSVHIHLDNPHAFYTNLDIISGKIILNLRSHETITTILVKLEGVSNTRLIRYEPPPREDGRMQFATESHKILYKVQQVISPAQEPASGAQSYILQAGQHEYPFRFKFPFNNGCATFTQPLSFGGIKLLEAPTHLQDKHVTKTLPPSLSGFPEMAEIRYFVKVTVVRPSLWKGNRRGQVGYKFLPIEPPRPPASDAESFARRTHAFQSGLATYSRKQSIFWKKPVSLSMTPPSVLLDARLPSPSILTCNEPVPLRLIVRKQTPSPEYVFLVGLQIELIGFTHIRAKDLTRMETGSWMVMSLTGLAKPVSLPNDPVGSEYIVESLLWDRVPLPRTVTPSFDACNLRRTYDVEVRVTIGYGHPGDIQPQTQTLPLRFPVFVYSGIAPTPALLSAMAAQNDAHTSAQTQAQPRPPLPIRPQSSAATPAQPQPQSRPPAQANDPLYPPQTGAPGAEGYGDAPPSYEDAIADDIGPLDGPRRDWSGVTNEHAPADLGDGDGDEKSRKWFV